MAVGTLNELNKYLNCFVNQLIRIKPSGVSSRLEILIYSMEQSPSWEANQSLEQVKKFPAFL
jgi:hypothetical protein